MCLQVATEKDHVFFPPKRKSKIPPKIHSVRSFLNAHVEQLLPGGRLKSPGMKKKRFASCRRIATAVAVDLRALIKEACFVWC